MPDIHLSLTLDVDDAARLAEKFVLDLFIGIPRDLDRAAKAVAFHAAGNVDSVSPQVVDEFLAPDPRRPGQDLN